MEEQQSGSGRRFPIIAIIVVVVVILLGLLWRCSEEPPVPAAPPAPPAAPAAPAPAAPPAPVPPQAEAAPTPPSFDLARISQDGTAVLAGRTPPQSVVDVLGNGQLLGTARAEGADGSWALVIDKPLPEGTLELALEARLPGGRVIRSDQVVLVDVPVRTAAAAPTPAPGQGGETPAPPVAVLTDRDPAAAASEPSRILQGPDGAASPGPLPGGSAPTLDLVEYGADGAPIIAGRAAPGATVRIYLGETLIAEVIAGPDGQWRVTPQVPVAPGRYTLRLDQVGPDGKVIARRELPFERATPEAVASAATPAPGTPAGEAATSFTVQPGNSLWRIARNQLGNGTRYLDIYRANEGQIRDPNLIYPGQVLTLP